MSAVGRSDLVAGDFAGTSSLDAGARTSAKTDRRSGSRLRVALGVKQRIGADQFLCQASDLSCSGMLLTRVFEHSPAPPARCWLEFSVPGCEQPVAVRAQVVREQRQGRYHVIGLKFASIAPSHRRLIGEYVRRRG